MINDNPMALRCNVSVRTAHLERKLQDAEGTTVALLYFQAAQPLTSAELAFLPQWFNKACYTDDGMGMYMHTIWAELDSLTIADASLSKEIQYNGTCMAGETGH